MSHVEVLVPVEAVETVAQAVADMRRLERHLAALVAFLCGWEFVSLTTRTVPPLSHGMWRLPTRKRLLVWVAVVAIGTDHFFSRRYV